MEPRKRLSRGPTLSHVWKATRMGATARALICPGVVVEPGMCRRSLSLGTGRARVRPLGQRPPVRVGKVRSHSRRSVREVRPRNRSWEADEQGGGETPRRCCGVGGAKVGGQGERGRAKHAPDPGSGARVTGARSRTESCKAEEGREVHCAPTPH